MNYDSIDIDQIFSLVSKASKRLSPFLQKTELIRLPWLDAPNREVWAKLECRQITGSFKIRGAINALLQIHPNKPIITYSAGNHGLAVAVAAEMLERKCIVYVPSNASELKIRKLARLGVEIECVGEDLFEAGDFAFKKAEKINAAFLTPFSSLDVVIGQGTISVELHEQIGQIDSIIVPLGGGGLLCGIAGHSKYQNPDVQIFASYPGVFGRDLSTSKPSLQMLNKVLPTIADGLAVQLEKNCWTMPIIDKLTTKFYPVSENLINIAIYSLIRQESIMSEGAGAVGIATLLEDPEGKIISGKTVVVISGGNISPGVLSKVFSTEVENQRYRTLLGLKALPVQGETPIYDKKKWDENGISVPDKLHLNAIEHTSYWLWVELAKVLLEDFSKLKNEVHLYEKYLITNNLRRDQETIHYIKNEIENVIKNGNSLIKKERDHKKIWILRSCYRTLLLKFGHLSSILDWASPSYDQSLEVMFFNLSEQASSMVNYDRFGSFNLRKFELKLMAILGFDSVNLTLIASSSGQAAYQIIESFLLREVFINVYNYIYVNYIYFEAFEQISSLKMLTGIKFSSNSPVELIDFVEINDSPVIFIDPCSNISGLPTFDFVALANLLENHNWSNKWLVIDGTIISGGLNPFLIFNKENHPRIIYYESGSKYIQLGLDIQMVGICVIPKETAPSFSKIRRNTGTIIYKSAIKKFPNYSRFLFLFRMQLISRNAARLANSLKIKWNKSNSIIVGYPWQWKELGWLYGGALVTIEFINKGLNNRDKLNSLIDTILQEAKNNNMAITNGVSFGFSTTRVSAASAMALLSDPFLRISVGEESESEIEGLVEIINLCLMNYLKSI